MMFDFAIIGAGPAGSMAALQLAKQGYKTIVFEEHNSIGIPVRCAGLVSEHVIKMHDEGIVNEIKGAIAVFPDGKEIVIGGDRTHAFVIDRRAFDSSLAEKAMAEGAEYVLGKKVKKTVAKKFFEIEGIKARRLIGADGPKSLVARQFNMGEIGFFNAIQGYGKYEMDGEFVKIFLSNEIAPGFFAWIIPADKARIGLATLNKNVRKYFNAFLKKLNVSTNEITAGLIPFGLRKFARERVALVGDAAGQTKATSGGGLYAGMKAAMMLAEHADNFLEYERDYMKSIGKELKRCIFMRKILNRMGDKGLNSIANIVEENIDLINKYGDIDYPSIVAKEIAKKHPLKTVAAIAKAFI
ncbi:MAG: NAD(P)/FAD-dependent oxidoreductase [Thermoplasmata archaeon]|nr:NAD(P)/FAD-dependent oxidoreductase [Thermoplasmata archaeon]